MIVHLLPSSECDRLSLEELGNSKIGTSNSSIPSGIKSNNNAAENVANNNNDENLNVEDNTQDEQQNNNNNNNPAKVTKFLTK